MAEPGRYDAFISYSNKLDTELAPALQKGLRALNRRWYRPYALRVFRDTTGLGVNASLWNGIESALAKADHFILLASPPAARSVWVGREVEWWQSHRSPDTFFVALTGGEIAWDPTEGDFDWDRTDALPRSLSGWFSAEPKYADLRWVRQEALSVEHSRFRSDVATLAAPIHKLGKDELEGEDIRQRRINRRIITGVLTVLSVLLVGVLIAASLAVRAQREALDQQRVAAARSLITAADAARNGNPPDIDTALRLGAAAYANLPNPETAASLVHTLAASPLATVLPGRFGLFTPLAVSPDDGLLAVADGGKSLQLWNLGGDRPSRWGDPLVSDYLMDFLAVSPDGRLLAAAGAGVLQLWDISDRAKPSRIQLPAMEIIPVGALAFSPDGRLLATGRGSELLLLDVSKALDPQVVSSVDILASIDTDVPVNVTAVAFASNAARMAVGYTNGLVGVWDVRDAGAPQSLTGAWIASTRAVAQLGLSPDASLIVTSEVEAVSLFSLTEGNARLVAHVDSSSGPTEAPASFYNAGFSTFVPHGRSAVTIVGRTVVWWDVTAADSPRETRRFTVDHTGGINYAALSASGRWLATSGDNGQVLLWDVTDSTRPQRLSEALGQLGADASKVAFAQRRPVVAVAAGDTVGLWSLEAGEPVPSGQVRRPGQAISAMALSPDGRILAVGGYDNNTTLWNIDNLAEPRAVGSPLTDFTNTVRAIAFSPDGTLLAVTGHPAMMLWDIGRPERPRRLGPKPVGQQSATTALAFSPDGRTVAAARDRDVVLLDVDDVTRSISELAGARQSTMQLMFSPDGRTLATGGDNPGVLLWDVTDRARPSLLGQPLPGYPGSVRHLAFAPDGRTLAVVADTARLWDLTDRPRPRPLGPPMETGGPLRPVAFAPDGHTLGIGTADHTIALWDLRGLDELRADPLRVACRRMSSVLDEATWSFYAPGLEYHDGCGR
ncbi:hypothetical protein [Nocardia sp. NPDC057455]|uniref:hypothetical protein n=1 Tax=Nocardia sp. NPDC057455 TaxID=3346138 RepID=UPI00366DAE15